jgi:xylose dehydrogenase (NAD/NADP)
MATRILRWGLISTAHINRALVPPLRTSARNQLVAVASRTSEQAQAFAKEWNIPRAFGSYEAMLADPDIDVVYNSLPNSLHAEWAIKAMQAGKHVLCEKPIAVTVEQVDAMAAAAQNAGVVLAEAFMYRHHLQTLKAQELVESGAIGELRLVHGSFTYNLARPGDVRLDPALDGGSIWDVGCYPISYARAVIGAEPVEVFGWQVIGPTGVDVTFVGQMRFAGNVIARFDSSFRMPDRAHMQIVGSDGVIDVPDPFKPERDHKILLTRNGQTETFTIPDQMLYLGEVEDMADAVLLGKAPRINLADSRGNVAAIVALLRSAREGRPVPIR